jgi:cell division protein FtsI (penicillin-binding protein 3)
VANEAPAAASDWRRTLKRRIALAAALFAAWSAAIEARLVYLQVVQHAELVARAERQQMRTVPAPAKRGEILDRHGRILAYSVDADSIYAVPTEIGDVDRVAAAVCGALDDCRPRDRDAIADRLRRQRADGGRYAFAYVQRQVSPEEVRRVAALNLEGIGFLKENRRYYPNRELASHLLGYVGLDNTGLGGIEAAYDSLIRGRAGKILIQTDARRSAFSRMERLPTAGATIELTIDRYLQHVVERELRAAVREHRAAGGTVVVMDPHTGEILALTNYPTYNPNEFGRYGADTRRNRAIQDVYEPGSTFKIVTASAAFEERIVRPDDPIDVSDGYIRFGARQIDDEHRYGVLSFEDVIVKSSNVGAIKVGLRVGAERLGRYIRRFGFGEALAPDFRGQSPGIVWDPASLSDSALASVSMGYQIGVTPLQMAAAVSSIANGGELLEPHAVRAVVRDRHRTLVPRKVLRRTVSAATAEKLTTIMEGVVERGTAKAAQLEGFTIAGKTGTAAKLIDGRYSHADFNASFVGFVPSRRPALTVLVVIDSPRAHGYYGGVVAAPVFKSIAEAALRHLGIPRTIDPEPPVLVAHRDAGDSETRPVPTPAVGSDPIVLPRDQWGLTPSSNTTSMDGLMPDLRGLGARTALRELARVGIAAELIGDGTVAAQDVPPGAPVALGAVCRLWLRRYSPYPGTQP